MDDKPTFRKGRGALSNQESRFLANHAEPFDDGWDSAEPPPHKVPTQVLLDRSRSIISYNRSPDVPFDRSINPYKGCEHGCIYCFARPSHAYLDLSPGLDFETRIFHKPNAAELLRQELAKPGYRPAPLALGANTDAYQPLEKRLRNTRAILEVLAECRHPLTIITKSALVERDLDLLAPMAEQSLVEVAVSVTSLDRELSRRLEPRAAAPQRRLKTIARLREAGVPVTVLVAPVIPALTDHELEAILEAVAGAGATAAGFQLLRLPHELKQLFREWLAEHAPLRADHVMSLLRQLRGGQDNQSEFGRRMTGEGVLAQLLARRFELACRRLGLNRRTLQLDCSRFRPPRRAGDQLTLF